MELVPILSTIILVGTIATFILAVFAYILYKIRERRSRERAAEQRPYAEPRRQPALGTPQPALALPGAMGQPAPASMYIAPTTTLPPQGPVVEVHEAREATPPAGGWTQPPQLEQAVAVPPAYARPRNGHSQPAPRLAPPQYETVQPPRRTPAPVAAGPEASSQQPGSMFWEYTDEGFVPVDPRQSAAREQQQRRAEEEQRRATEAQRRRRDDENDDTSAWL